MSFSASHIVTKNGDMISQSNNKAELSNNQLNIKEIEILLSLIKRSTFIGEDIEPLYNLIIKLQNQYLSLK
jgi:hypothetical protein